jgi:hypothetical protein
VKATFAILGYAVAAVLVVVGAGEVWHDVYRSLHYDGGMAFDAAGNAVVARLGAIRIGKVEIDWLGLAMLISGGLLAAGVHQAFRKP